MPMKIIKKEIEAEYQVGFRYIHVTARAESLVPGAGRENIDILLCDANAALIGWDVQNDRVVLDGTLNCQAVYRMGEENTLRALSAKSSISQAVDVQGAEVGMMCRTQASVESVDVRYENGHMVFQAGIGIRVWVMELEQREAVEKIEDAPGVEQRTGEICLAKLAAEANETAVLTGRVELPGTLDARTSLMDWGSVQIDTAEPDLGGMRVKGKVMAEALIASGIEGKPAVAVKYPVEFDKLIELPEWLAKEAQVRASVRSLRTQVEQGQDDEDAMLVIQADVYFDIAANVRNCTQVLTDAYAVAGRRIEPEKETFTACTQVNRTQTVEIVRGTVMPGDGGVNIGSIIASRVLPCVSEVRYENGRSRIGGLFDVMLLYMPSGSDRAAGTRAVMEFSVDVPQMLEEESMIAIEVTNAEASALMGDRVDMKIGLNVMCETRVQSEFSVIEDVEEGNEIIRRPGYIIYWPENGEDAWNVGKRYGIAESEVSAGGEIVPGKPLVMRI